ncbi:MAG: 30S ribosomal protein S1, partial [Planctomycetota bacterium]
MSSDPNDQPNSPHAGGDPAASADTSEVEQEETASVEPDPAAGPSPSDESPQGPGQTDRESPQPGRQRGRILIGSQRDPAAYRPKPKRDSIPIVGIPGSGRRSSQREKGRESAPQAPDRDPQPPNDAPTAGLGQEEVPANSGDFNAAVSTPPEPVSTPSPEERVPTPLVEEPVPAEAPSVAETGPGPVEGVDLPDMPVEAVSPILPESGKKFPPPSVRDRLPPDLEDEFRQALGDESLDELIADGEAVTRQSMLEADTQHTGRVVMIRREDVFVELGGREQGVLPLKEFEETPELGDEVTVRVTRFNPEEGLYELVKPGAAADVGDWSDLEEGMIVEAKVTGQNSGGLECEVNHLRGFIPVSQIALYRVDDLAPFVDEKLTCLVTECNPERRNLVLSRRAVLEREREEARRTLLDSLEPGQIREGVVRKLVDFGAFVDLGGVDGLLHVSQLAWGRVAHPREVLHEGQTVRVKVQSVDQATKRISLAYRDLLENPWTGAQTRYPENTSARGRVTKLMDFGA